MPIYEYQCDGCGEVFEVRQRISDPPPAAHACGSAALHRVLSATSFVLKGTGWYATDYGNRSQPPKEGGEGGKADAKGSDAKGAGGEKGEGAKADGNKAPAAAPSAGGKGEGAKPAPTKAAAGTKGGGGPAAA